MAETRRLKELVESNLARLRLPGGAVTVALSGGADSAALALLCREAMGGLDAIHVDHGLSGSPRLAAAAGAIADRLGVRLRVVQTEVGEGASPEAQAREARYRVLTAHPGAVLTGHTLDDVAETMLLNLVRGTGAAGLAGIPYHRAPNIYRPMLETPRSETREIASLAGLPFVEDPMNQDLDLARNRVRLRVLPLLRELNPRVVEALARAAASIAADHALLDSMTPILARGDGVPVGVVVTLPRPLADRLLHRLLEASGVAPSADRLARVWEVALGEAPAHDLAGGRRIARRGAMLVIE